MPKSVAQIHVVETEGGVDEAPAGKRTPGFGMIPAAVYGLNDAYVLAVYAVLAKHATADGICWPSIQRIRDQTGLGKTKVLESIAKLEAAKLVEIQHQSRHGMKIENRYILLAHTPAMERRRADKLAADATIRTDVRQADNVVRGADNVVRERGSPGGQRGPSGGHKQDHTNKTKEQERSAPSPLPQPNGYFVALGKAKAKIVKDFTSINPNLGLSWLADALGSAPVGLPRPALLEALGAAYEQTKDALSRSRPSGDLAATYQIRNPNGLAKKKVVEAITDSLALNGEEG